MLVIATLIVSINLIHAIYLLDGIENTGRVLAIITLIVIDVAFINEIRRTIIAKKKKHILLILFSIIYLIISIFISLFIKDVYSNIKDMNKVKISYATSLVALKDNDDIVTVGVQEDNTSIEGYVLPIESLEDKDYEIKYFDSYASSMKALYDEDIDAIFMPNGFESMFIETEKYKNILEDTKIVYTYEKEFNKDEQIISKNLLTEPFSILLMGIDSEKEGINNQTGNGDALILMTVNPNTLTATMVSVPRDSYVKQACFKDNVENKITHASWGGTNCMIETIENFLDIDIDYYVKINFRGVVQLVDALGGIVVDIPKTVCTDNSRRQGEVCVEKGLRNINGEQALVFARNRYDFANGDLDRAAHQQMVIEGIINSTKNIKSINDVTDILDVISNNIDTNLTANQILSSYNLFKKVLLNAQGNNLINVQKLCLNGEGQMIYDEGMGMVLWNYILYPDSIKQVSDAMKMNLEIIDYDIIKEFDYSIDEPYKQNVIGKDVYGTSGKYSLLPDFTDYTKQEAISWLGRNGFSYSIVEKENTQYETGTIIDQSIPGYKRLDKITNKHVTLTISKLVEE